MDGMLRLIIWKKRVEDNAISKNNMLVLSVNWSLFQHSFVTPNYNRHSLVKKTFALEMDPFIGCLSVCLCGF